ncbi:hypothetical protein PVAP13_3NG187723 [Panicum virgatum]|uniref:Uncharacterized protein n=1 Tax=Panicum virgatum TaxID=38727 RepID=A0A8T0U1Q8_PANVG|nr:hypothetical protein PVAP13_3NG187723 [Panicum virgatum]
MEEAHGHLPFALFFFRKALSHTRILTRRPHHTDTEDQQAADQSQQQRWYISSPLVTGTALRPSEGRSSPLYQLPSYSLPLPSSSPTSPPPPPPSSGVVFHRPPPGHAKVRFLTPDSADPSRSCS